MRRRSNRDRGSLPACLPACGRDDDNGAKVLQGPKQGGDWQGKWLMEQAGRMGGGEDGTAIKLANECQLLLLPRLRLETSSAPNQKTL